MIFVFYFFAAILVLLSYKSARGGIEYLRFFKTELAKPRSDFTPFASIIAPCRGLDEGMEQNLAALFEQDYPACEVVFVVDDAVDPAVAVITGFLNRRDAETQRKEAGSQKDEYSIKSQNNAETQSVKNSASPRLCGENRVSARLVISAKASGSSQKVENLREAVLHVASESQIFVFVDSDVRPAADWMRNLVAPLQDEKVGAATGYRWFISNKPGFGSEMRSVWNASIASALGKNTRTNFCWGGSMAIRRDTFERVGMREKWRGTLSDDFAVTNAMKAADMPICFVPRALSVSIEDCTLAGLFEFTTRQMKITRVYAPKLWIKSFVGSGFFNVVMIAAFLIVIFRRLNDLAVVVSITTLVLVSSFSIGKAWLRLEAVRLVLTNYKTQLRRQLWTQNTLWLFAPALFFYNSLAAWLSRRMTWRGTTYELKSPTETVIITD